MYYRYFKALLANFTLTTRKIVAGAALAYALSTQPFHLRDEPSRLSPFEQFQFIQSMDKADQFAKEYIDRKLKDMRKITICKSNELIQGQVKTVEVEDDEGRKRQIMATRYRGKVYALVGQCTYQPPFEESKPKSSLKGAAIFNDKLYCPHHGCVFDIETGNVEHGPATNNLPRLPVDQTSLDVIITYPIGLPTSIQPQQMSRDPQDFRKVLIAGGDDEAVIGCIHSLRQFGFSGEIHLIMDQKSGLPLEKNYLHKFVNNFHLLEKYRDKHKGSNEVKTNETTKSVWNNFFGWTQKKIVDLPSLAEKPIDKVAKVKTIQDEVDYYLKNVIFPGLQMYPKEWYDYQGVIFYHTSEDYQIVNKRFYPYITFLDGTKIEFDAMLVATGLLPQLEKIKNITVKNRKDDNYQLPENVFAPVRNKREYTRLMHFLNAHTITSLFVLGLNTDSLEFIECLHKQFPQIKVNVLDQQKSTTLTEVYGPEIQREILKEYTKRGVEFYLKILKPPQFTNKFMKIQKKKKSPYLNIDFSFLNLPPEKHSIITQEEETKYKDSVAAQLTADVILQADGVIIFPNKFQGSLHNIRQGKYTDLFYTPQNQVQTDHYLRTDSKRIFAAGGVAALSFFATQMKMMTTHSTTIYEMGYNAGLNIQALRVPFYYIPVEFSKYFDKRLIYLGARNFYNTIANIGSIQDWDFITIYSVGSKIVGACASPSKQQEISVLREAFRLSCMPPMEGILSGQVTFRDIQRAIKKLNKSGCYKDEIHKIEQNINTKDLLWMERSRTAGFMNDHPDEELPKLQVDEKGIVKQV